MRRKRNLRALRSPLSLSRPCVPVSRSLPQGPTGALAGYTSLILSGRGLSGTLPHQLRELRGMTSIRRAPCNAVTGVVLSEVSRRSFPETTRLLDTTPAMRSGAETARRNRRLDNNLLSGTIPSCWGNNVTWQTTGASTRGFDQITGLYLNLNRLSGPIPQNLGLIGPGRLSTSIGLWGNALRGAPLSERSCYTYFFA